MESHLHSIEDQDPREIEIQRYRDKDREQEMRTRLQQESAQRQKQSEERRQIEERADAIIDEAHTLAEEFPSLSAEELILKFQHAAEDVTLKSLAEDMHAKRVDYYKKHLASQHRSPRNAPAPISSQGASAPIDGHSADDMVAYLESLGD